MKSYRDPAATWLGSPNFWRDRQGHDMAIQPAYVVIHTMVGTIAGANSRFQIPSEGASAHYGVGLDGRLVQWVDEKDAAWHAGNAVINLDSVGVEHEDGGRYNDPRPDALYTSSAALVRGICLRYGLPIDRAHIRAHREVSDAPTACPDALDVDRIVRMAAGLEPLPGQLTSSSPGGGTVILFKGANGRTHRLLVADGEPLADGTRGGPVHWIVIDGGAGALDRWDGSDAELPGGGGWIAAGTLAYLLDVVDGVEQLSLEGVGRDGRLWQVSVRTNDYQVTESWHPVAAPRVALPGRAGVPGPAGPPGSGVSDEHIAAVAVAEIGRRMTK